MGEYREHGAGLVWGQPDLLTQAPRAMFRALVRAMPSHPANAVKALYSYGGGPEREVRGHRIGADPVTGADLFAVDLPAAPTGLPMAWRPVLSRSGRVLDPRRSETVPAPAPTAAAAVVPVAPSHPARFDFEPKFMFRVTAPVFPDDSPVGETPDGLRLLFALRDGGTVRGPALNGEIMHKGGDWMRVRSDGMGVCAIDALIRPDDGGVVLSEYSGLVDFGPDGYAALARGGGPRRAPLRFAPRYLTAVEKYKWINRLQCFSIGEVDLERHIVEYDLYAFGPTGSGGQP